VDQVLHDFLTIVMQRLPDITGGVPRETKQWVESWVDTLGQNIRATLPGGDTLVGIAVGLGDDGSLTIAPRHSPHPVALSVGDIVHLRHREG
jgi:BirA family biotin operon repressor/biotin-[acetyl-CoA-carboxylase] ligase